MKKNSDNPFFKVNNFLNGRTCKKIIEEIDKFEKFDDLVMSGRKRINKGSENFNRFLKISKASKKFFNKINNFNFFKKIKPNLLKSLKKENWIYKADNLTFSKSLFGAQKGKRITNIKTNLRKNIMYLDMDFSVSEKGYNRGPHRDRESRVINFLIYLNTLAKKDGGTLSFYQTKNKKNYTYPRFPKKKDVYKSHKINAKEGVGVFFLSSPNSYHSVSKFYGKVKKKRYFIYGSYSLNKAVTWFKKDKN